MSSAITLSCGRGVFKPLEGPGSRKGPGEGKILKSESWPSKRAGRETNRPLHKYHVKSPKYLSGNSQKKMSKCPKKCSKYVEKSSKYLEISRLFVLKLSRF